MYDPFQVVQVVRDFEFALCDYTGSPYAVTTTSCTMALLIALKQCNWHGPVNIPKRTYVGVGMSIKHSGREMTFRDEKWVGEYQLQPTNIWDSARRFTSSMYRPGMVQCVSFHWSKILGIGQGGAILHDDEAFDGMYRKMRFDGRSEGVPAKEDAPEILGYHAYMMPRDAAEGLSRLSVLPKENADLPWDDYPDLSTMRLFK